MSSETVLKLTMNAGDTSSTWQEMLGHADTRGFQGQLTSGDSVTLQFTNEDLDNADRTDMSEPGTTVAQTYMIKGPYTTVQFADTFLGDYRFVRAVKTGANGPVRVLVEG